MGGDDNDWEDVPGLDLGPTTSLPDLTNLTFEDAVEAIRDWFFENFEDPAENTPYESREGGYQYIWGGPYDAREEVSDAFYGVVAEEVIDAAVDAIETHGNYEWAPSFNRIGPEDEIRNQQEPHEEITSPPIPSQSEAPLQVTFVNGVLKALPPHMPELASADATLRAQEAYDALKEMADAIHGNLAGGNYPHVSQAMSAYCRALGDNFQSLRQIALGMHGERLKAQAATAHEFMPDVLAADLKGLAAAHAMFLQRFEVWQAFLDDVKKSPLDPAKAEAARPDARGIITELQGQANIDEEVILSLREQESDLDDGGTHDQVRSQGFYRSLNNVLIALFEQATSEIGGFVSDVVKDLRPRAVVLASGAIVSTPVAMLVDHLCGTHFLSPLASHLSEALPWLLPMIDWWKHRPGK